MGQELSIKEVMNKLQAFLSERDWEKFHDPKNLAMSISIEAAELMELFQWRTNSEASEAAVKPETLERVREELADVMLYCFSMAQALDIDIARAMIDKIALNARRYPADRFRGIARKYNETTGEGTTTL
jgi:dCTP diphosphatase